MQRRNFLKLLSGAVSGASISAGTTLAADSELDCGVWYDAEISGGVDGDTFDVYVYENGEEYNIRTLGHDTPEKSGNTHYEKTQEWEFIEDAAHLEDWGNKATDFAKDELPVGSQCQIKLDCESEEIDQYGRLLAKIRYDRDGDGVMETVWNKLTVEEGYARVYSASMSNTDEYLELERKARANGVGLWSAADGHASEWRNTSVTETFHPHTSSIKTTDGKLPSSRAPVWAEPEAVQENTSWSTVDYDSGNVPMVGVDETNNVAYFGGCIINERWEDESAALDHFVFVTNLVDYLHDSDDPSGPVLVDSGHHTFGEDNAVSAEDTAYYQRYLEGVDIELHGIHTYGNGNGYSLSEARALVASCGPDEWTQSEIDEVSSFLDDGGVLLLMGSGSETADERANLDDLAAGVGTDLRLNYDDVRDDTNYVGDSRKLLKTSNRNTADFDLWSAYDASGGLVSTGSVADVTDNSATLNGTLDSLDGADSAEVSFEWGPAGDLSNTTATQTLTSTGSFSHELSGLEYGTEYEFRAVAETSDGDAGDGDASNFMTDDPDARTDVLDASPQDPEVESAHTWTLADPSNDFSGEVDTITVEYPSGTSLDGLTNDDVTVYMDRDGDGTVDEIPVNSDEYSGNAATFDLNGVYNTSVEGEVRVEIDGLVNPSAGEYVATETLDGDDTHAVDAEFVVTGFSVSTDAAADVTETAATLDGTLNDLDGADSAEVSFEWGPVGDRSNTTAAQTLSATGSFSEEITGLDANTEYEFRAVADASDGETAAGTVTSFTTSGDARTDVLSADPNTAGSSSSHTWTLSDPSADFSGEVDTVTVDYPGDTSLDGLTDGDVTVYMDRDGDGTVDEIPVNSDEYSGSAATFDLDGRYNTSVEGEVRVEIDGVENPGAGEYVATETLDGDDTHAVDAEFVVE